MVVVILFNIVAVCLSLGLLIDGIRRGRKSVSGEVHSPIWVAEVIFGVLVILPPILIPLIFT